jgi:ParB-like chromosome segregation protein Spo0J
VPAQFLETRDIPLAELTPFPGNARRGNVSKIRESIRKNGQYRSLVVRHVPDGLIILAGNHTFQALRAEGSPTARCEVIRCDDDEARRINLADNRLSDMAEDDPDALVELLSYLEGDYEGTGWTQEAVDKLIDPPIPDSADLDPGEDKYQEQYGVIVVCEDEAGQQQVYEELQGAGYNVKVVTT